jgi:hypothetical protein
MITDAVFKIGASHRVCQDYALAKPDSVHLSDGCSSGRNTDIGSRFLTWLLAHNPSYADSTEEGNSVIQSYGITLGLTRDDLVATYLEAREHTALILGDGYIFQHVNNCLRLYEYKYTSNAPFYLAYKIFNDMDKWEQQFPDNKCELTEYVFDDKLNLVEKYDTENTFQEGTFKLIEKDCKYYGIASDGLSSFQDSNKNPIGLDKVVPILFNFKNLNPGFLQRRVQMAEKEFAKLGWSHYDDLSMGVIAQ